MYNPLAIFAGAALATLAALLGVTYDRWSATAHDQIAAVETKTETPAEGKLQDMAAPAAAEDPALAETELASIAPEQSTAPMPAPESPAAQAEPPADGSKPTFDTIRIERDGSAVIAGRGLPKSDVTVMLNGSPLGSVKTDLEGAWVFIPNDPVPPGDHQLTLRMHTAGTSAIESEQSVALKVPERLDEEALVVLSDADQPSKVLQKPEASANETTVAKSEAAAASQGASAALTLGTVDYNNTGNIIFSGRGDAGTNVRLYVDNRRVGDAVAMADGTWTFAGNETIAPGNHSLRVDQLRPDGSVSHRIELPFVRATPEDVASLNLPAEPQSHTQEAPSASQETTSPPAGEASSGGTGVPASTVEPAPADPQDEPPSGPPAAMEDNTLSEVAAVEGSQATDPPHLVQPEDTETVGTRAPPAPEEPSLQQNGRIVIQPGNSLWRISRVIYGRGIEYSLIFEANKDHIRNPNLIYPGQIFATPGVVPPESIDPRATVPLAKTTVDPTSQQ